MERVHEKDKAVERGILFKQMGVFIYLLAQFEKSDGRRKYLYYRTQGLDSHSTGRKKKIAWDQKRSY